MRAFGRVLLTLAACGAWLAVLSSAIARPSAQDLPTVVEFKPPPPPAQPIAYSHRAHLEQGLECLECHVSAETDARATFPPTSTCMSCHAKTTTRSAEIVKLAGYDGRNEGVPWARVYRLPVFVYFSHAQHMTPAAGLSCETCHGNVRGMDLMQKVKDTSMAACMECHKEKSAPNRCDSCHDPI